MSNTTTPIKKAFKDSRYITVDGRLLFVVFDSTAIPDFGLFKKTWNELAREDGLKGFLSSG